MKQCPKCRTTYTDESLRFCLADGTPLESVSDSVPTYYPGKTDQIRIDVPPTQAARFSPMPVAERPSSGRWVKIVIGVLLVGILGIAAVAIVGALIYFNSAHRETAAAEKTPTPTATPAQTPDKEKQKLEDELANLQRRLDEEKKPSANTKPTPATADSDETKTYTSRATVNSPSDGFLALRSLPDANYGERIAKIPHGSTVDVISCADDQVTIGSHTGHWCLITYQSNAGFVFDAFLDY
jgi:hypothetical protein